MPPLTPKQIKAAITLFLVSIGLLVAVIVASHLSALTAVPLQQGDDAVQYFDVWGWGNWETLVGLLLYFAFCVGLMWSWSCLKTKRSTIKKKHD